MSILKQITCVFVLVEDKDHGILLHPGAFSAFSFHQNLLSSFVFFNYKSIDYYLVNILSLISIHIWNSFLLYGICTQPDHIVWGPTGCTCFPLFLKKFSFVLIQNAKTNNYLPKKENPVLFVFFSLWHLFSHGRVNNRTDSDLKQSSMTMTSISCVFFFPYFFPYVNRSVWKMPYRSPSQYFSRVPLYWWVYVLELEWIRLDCFWVIIREIP